MRALEPYPRYTGAGVEWLDEIPAEWNMRKLGNLFDLQRRRVMPGDEIVTAFRDGQVTLRRRRRMEGFTEADKEIGYQGVREGDLVIHNMDGFAGAIGVADSSGKSTPVYSVASARAGQNAQYFAYLLRHLARTEYITALARGIRERSTDFRWSSAREVPVPVPDSETQDEVVCFLNRETTEIDAFIADQEELIRLLSERRAATISHAVTKGLDASALMKESGVEWFGEVPADWTLTPFASAVSFREGPGIGAVDFRDDGVPLIRVSGLRERFATLDGCNYLEPAMVGSRWRRFQIERGDLLVSASASMGTVSEAGDEVLGAIPYTGIIRMKPRRGVDRDFLRLYLQSATFVTQVDRLKTGSTIQHYGPEHLRQMNIALPPESEQRLIAAQVSSETIELDAAIADAGEAIVLSKERRAALISAAVTGKIDVRGLA